MHVSELNIFPLKSARGIALQTSAIDARGLPGDRRAMLTDPQGKFVTQRELPALARLRVIPADGSIGLAMEGKGEIKVALPSREYRIDVTIWRSQVSAAVADENTNDTLSRWLGRPLRLVFFDDLAERFANEEWAGERAPVTFSDGYQVLVTTTASLKAMNDDMAAHGQAAVDMSRFRANIVLDHDEAWAEDRWTGIDIGGILLDFVKPCPRCIMITQDQASGSRDVANPMPAMGRIRMSADKRVPGPLFGWNAVPRNAGTIAVGDAVSVIGEHAQGWAIRKR